MNKRGQITRNQIKEKAYFLFAERGFKDITMKDICDITGLSRGGLYCHYSSPGSVFAEIIMDLQDNQADLFSKSINQSIPATKILDETLNQYREEMMDHVSSLSIAIYEYFSMEAHENKENTIYKQYLLSASMWRELIQYGIGREEFKQVDVDAVLDLILFSYQGVRMFSKIMPIDEQIPRNIVQEIRNILIK